MANTSGIPVDYNAYAATGLAPKQGLRFFYFFQNFGVFPVAVMGIPDSPPNISPEELLPKIGPLLRNDTLDETNWGRVGDYGRIYLFKPSVWLGADPENASVKPLHILIFLLSLIGIIVAFHRQNRLWQGVVLALLVGSSSFQLLETYLNENIMSLPISVALIVMAMNLRFFNNKSKSSPWDLAVALCTGLLIATIHQVRTEPSLIGLSILPLYLAATNFSWRHRALLCVAFIGSYLALSQAWTSHFKGLQKDAIEFVQANGGKPFQSTDIMHHPIWHPIFCGLGDFGSDRGYAWDDKVAYDYALPKLQEKLSPSMVIFRSYLINRLEPINPYPIKPEGFPLYDSILKEKILSDVKSNPLWYANIIFKRTLAIFTESLPIELDFILFRIRLPLGFWLAPLISLFFLYRRSAFEIKSILFMAPLSLTPLLIYSGRGNTFFQIGHLVALALLANKGLLQAIFAKKNAL